MSHENEKVICLPSPVLKNLLSRGLNRISLESLLVRTGFRWMPRSEADQDERYRHLATYAVLTCGDRVFAYRRGGSGSEDRLHDRWSIGVGGHVTVEDIGAVMPDPSVFRAAAERISDAVRYAARREVNEEVAWDGPVATAELGLIVDDSNPVGLVHLGVAYRYELADTSATAREDCLADARWVTLDEARVDIESYESWSRILIEELVDA